jgi:HEAT repeat protein
MQTATVTDVRSALVDPAPEVRRAACELATTLPTTDRIDLLDDNDARVVEACAFALGECEDHKATPALMRIASDHSDPLCREAAVASLGAIGDEQSRQTLITALSDIAQIRRRALIALSNFEGDDVDLAMRKCLDDRDWQVRQAAEDLLGTNAAEQQ